MHAWNVSLDPESGRFTHEVGRELGHSLLGAIVGSVFESLRVSASVWDGAYWWPIHTEANLLPFEHEHGVETKRWAYNERHFSNVLRHSKAIRGTHAGYCDLFVPILVGGSVAGILVVGPFALARPTSANILQRWRLLTGRQGHPMDPEFTAYLRATLGTLVLDGARGAGFEELLTCYGRLMGGEGRADTLTNRALALRQELQRARIVEQSWDAVRAMVHDRSSLTHYSQALAYDLRHLGLSGAANQVLVGLAVGKASELDPVDYAVRRDAFQRDAVELARETGETLAGQVGDHGVVFVSTGPPRRANQKLLDLSKKAAAIARRRFGLAVHFGASIAARPVPLSRCYQGALAAAESALSQGARLVTSDPGEERSHHSLADLRDQLGREVQERPDLLAARFDRYLEAVAIHCGYRIEAARAHLEVGFERAADGLLRSGTLDGKSHAALRSRLARVAGETRTINELFEAYRHATADLSEAVQRPVSARRGRGVRAALEFMGQHYGEPLSLEKVARVAGFAPHYFSELFRKREHTTFEKYLAELRLERAKQLLSGTELSATRVAELTGHRSPQYLCRVFRAAVGVTPLQYRRGKLPFWAKRRANRIGTQDKV